MGVGLREGTIPLMRYLSTRGGDAGLSFVEVLLRGLAGDGGLYMPEAWPTFEPGEMEAWRGLPYAELSARVMHPFMGGFLSLQALQRITDAAYATFEHAAVAPLAQLGPDRWLMELFHGPTLAFKDVAMQVLGRLYDRALEQRGGGRITVVGATSGDTGSAAIEAFRGREHVDIFILHPHGRTSEVQRRQMTTVDADNVYNIAIEGSFDDCQRLLKSMFADDTFRERVRLSGVNSINWARVLPQVVYYVYACLALGADEGRPVHFSVPTGNFGDVFAGYVAKRIGAPIGRLIIATNSNDILTRALETGEHTLGEVMPTLSPSMDIQVSSNFERLLYEVYDRDAPAVVELMTGLREHRRFTLPTRVLDAMRRDFAAHRVTEEETLATIRRVYEETREVIDPHTTVGIAAAEAWAGSGGAEGGPIVTLATAHPAKFPEAVERAIGVRPPLPPRMADLFERAERYAVLPDDLAVVQAYIHDRIDV